MSSGGPATVPASAPLALHGTHEDLGATFGSVDGRLVPLFYGDLRREHRALVDGHAFVDRSFVDVLELRGNDRRRFLHGLVTCDVQGLQAGASTSGFFTSAQGRVLAQVTVLAREQSLLLELPAGCGAAMAAHMTKYVIADDVQIEPRPDLLAISILGADAELDLGAAELAPGNGTVAAAALCEVPVLADRRPVWGVPALTLWVKAPDGGSFFQRLLEAGRCVGLMPIGIAALETRRVELGVPRFGRDFGPDHFPQETGLEAETVSYSKGCYLGQEVIARIHYRGQVNRTLRGLRLPPSTTPAACPDGTALELESRAVGTLSSAVTSPLVATAIALAIVHRRGAEPGTRLALPDGSVAEVVALPFA
jgi:folate-binding protein YgfZ